MDSTLIKILSNFLATIIGRTTLEIAVLVNGKTTAWKSAGKPQPEMQAKGNLAGGLDHVVDKGSSHHYDHHGEGHFQFRGCAI